MNTGDEPMLPQPADDNAPMISGRGTKIIADARGAYLAGNIPALVDHMDKAQRQHFKRTLLKQLISFAEFHAQHLPHDSTAREANAAARLYIDQPTRHNWNNLRGLQARVTATILYDNNDDWAFQASCVATGQCLGNRKIPLKFKPESIVLAVGHVVAWSDNFPRIWSDYLRLTPKWQLEVAWNILQGKQLPPFELPS